MLALVGFGWFGRGGRKGDKEVGRYVAQTLTSTHTLSIFLSRGRACLACAQNLASQRIQEQKRIFPLTPAIAGLSLPP